MTGEIGSPRAGRRGYRKTMRVVHLSLAFLWGAAHIAEGQPALMSTSAALGTEGAVTDLSFLPEHLREAILSGTGLSETGDRLGALSLWRGAPFGADLVEMAGSMPRSLAADSWTLIRFSRRGGDEGLHIYRAFTAFSTMKGLKTKSAIFGGEEDFILDSCRVDSAVTKRRMPDPVARVAPESASFVLYGRDALAGGVYYDLDFDASPSWYRVTLRNVTAMRSLLLRLAEPGELLTAFYILPVGEGVLLYGITLARTPLIPGTVGLERTILADRMIAIGKWFAANLVGETTGG